MDIRALEKWEHPSDYGGFSSDGDYFVLAQTRDSDALERSNYERVFECLQDAAEAVASPESVYDFRAGSWACGWIEYILIDKNAPESLIMEADEIMCALSEYPVFDDEHFSMLQMNEANDYWENLDVRSRGELLIELQCNVSIFAARRSDMPYDINLMEYCSG